MVKKIVFVLLTVLTCLPLGAVQKHRFTLVIDAGHGGRDAGACANRAKEKNINLSVALAFGRYVERNCPDVRVIYTRKTDVFIPLRTRADIANKNKADVFISVHTNALPGKRPKPVSGLETYTMGMRRSDEKLSAAKRENEVILLESDYRQHYAGYDPRSPESMMVFEVMNEQNMLKSVQLAQLIQRNVSSTAHRPNHGVKQDAFLVLRETSMPACLVELGYITTPAEAAFLTSKANVEAMGLGLYQAFVAYKRMQTGSSLPVKAGQRQEPEDEPAVAAPSAADGLDAPEESATEPSEKHGGKTAAEQKRAAAQDKQASAPQAASASQENPVFKVQVLTSGRKLRSNDPRLKGHREADCYQEGGQWKYTIGASENYNEVNRLRKQLQRDFPQAFVIAFKGGVKMDPKAAYDEYVNKKKKKK